MLYEFYVHDMEVEGTVSDTLDKLGGKVTSERLLEIVYRPQALFRVRAVSRCTSSMPGRWYFITFYLSF